VPARSAKVRASPSAPPSDATSGYWGCHTENRAQPRLPNEFLVRCDPITVWRPRTSPLHLGSCGRHVGYVDVGHLYHRPSHSPPSRAPFLALPSAPTLRNCRCHLCHRPFREHPWKAGVLTRTPTPMSPLLTVSLSGVHWLHRRYDAHPSHFARNMFDSLSMSMSC
jgi:hypothetical protein